ncbi:24039_t:CDS:2, partial [Gigaspora margarita]
VLTFQIQELCKQCIRIDKSEKMIQVARNTNNCKDTRVANAEKLNDWIEENGFTNYFDAVFSNAALHWMKNQNEVIKAIHKYLKPGGRLVTKIGSHRNIKNVEDSLIASLEKH